MVMVVTDSNCGWWPSRRPGSSISRMVLAAMDEWNQKTHGRSGPIDKVPRQSDEAVVGAEALEFPEEVFFPGHSRCVAIPIGQDRRFHGRATCRLEAFFTTEPDVSTLKELCKRWQPGGKGELQKRAAHGAGRYLRVNRRTEVLPGIS